MKNEIVFKFINDLEARMQAEYIHEGGTSHVNRDDLTSAEMRRDVTRFVAPKFISGVYTERAGMACAWRIRKWLSKRYDVTLTEQYDWWVNVNDDAEYTPDNDIAVNYYVKTPDKCVYLCIWNNKIVPQLNHAYAFPGRIKYWHTPNTNQKEDRMIISYGFNIVK